MGRGSGGHVNVFRASPHPPRPSLRTPLMAEWPGTTGDWRLLRGLIVGGVATALAVGGHALAGGGPPPWTTVVVLAVLLGTVATWLSRARWTLLRLLALLLLGQAGLHAVMVGAQPSGHPGHPHHVTESASALLPEPAMVAGHVAAAVATALLLRHGEAWLGGVLAALALRAVRLLDGLGRGYGGVPEPLPVGLLDQPCGRSGAGPRWQRGPPR
jgi:hypothetical protein